MKQTNLKTAFTGYVDKDSDRRSIDPENMLHAENVHNAISEAGVFAAITNALGNRNIPISFIQAQSRVIGSHEDKKSRSSIEFVWSNTGNHQIRRYYGDTGLYELIKEYNFAWSPTKYISNIDLVNGEQGELLYWTDDKPRKINITKATNNKARKYDLIFIGALGTPGVSAGTISIVDENGNTLASVTSGWGTTQSTVNVLNVNLGAYGTFTLCDGKIEFEFNSVGTNILTATPIANNYMVAIPSNFYPSITEQVIYAGKYPLPCMPSVDVKIDGNINYNYVDRKIFQFRTRVYYDDFDRSVLSPISDISSPGCGASWNYVEVDFTDPMLNTLASLAIIRRVDILAREGNNGKWKVVKTLEREELWWDSAVFGLNIFKFYNDGTYTVIDDDLALQQYDPLPIAPTDNKYSIGQEFTDNRLMYSNFKENYEKPCTNATIDVDFVQPERKRRFNIIGILRLFSDSAWFVNTSDFVPATNRGFIQNSGVDANGNPSYDFYGGHYGKAYMNAGNAAGAFQQVLPEGGWPVYLAGTDHFAVSRQKEVSLSQTASGAINTSTQTLIASLATFYTTTSEDVFSTYEIKSVPAGRYVLRVGSGWCSLGDKLGKGSFYDLGNGQAYQRTSTTLKRYNAAAGGSSIDTFELTIDIDEAGNFQVFILGSVVKSGVANPDGSFYIGDLYIEDIIPPDFVEAVNSVGTTPFRDTSFCGYVLDTGAAPTIENLKTSTGVELAEIEFYAPGSGSSPTERAKSDHNGFWYLKPSTGNSVSYNTKITTPTGDIKPVTAPVSCNSLLATTILNWSSVPNAIIRQIQASSILQDVYETDNTVNQDVVAGTGQGVSKVGPIGLLQYVIPVYQNINNHKTIIQGRVVDAAGEGLSGVRVLLERNGRQEETDASGNFSILVYEDLLDFANRRILDDLILNSCVCCEAIFSNGLPYTFFGAPPINIQFPTYNSTTPYAPSFLNDVLAALSAASLGKYLKDGNKYRWSLMFSDEMDRRHDIEVISETYIPFITELVQQYYPSLPNIQADGTFLLTLNLAGVIIPSWATKLRVLRTKGSLYNSYIQMPVNQVKYVVNFDSSNDSLIETTYASKNATEIYVDINNSLINYQDFHSDSVLGTAYPFTVGDRLRLIRTDDGTLSPLFIDVPIKDIRKGYLVIDNNDDIPELKSGALIEAMSPKLIPDDDTEFFYEIPYCIDIVNGQLAQTSIPLVTGDTYRRERTVFIGGGTVSAFIEDAGISDFWESIAQDIGRVNFSQDGFGQQLRTNAIRFSDKFHADSKLNGLASFKSLNIKETERSYGAIMSIKESKDSDYRPVLVAIHERKCVSIYIGAVQYRDAAGQIVVSLSDEVLGTQRTMLDDYGTQDPHTVRSIDGSLYWWDTDRNTHVRYAQNGLTAINNGMISYFQTIGTHRVVTMYDIYYKEYIATHWRPVDFTLSGTVYRIDDANVKVGQWVEINNTLYQVELNSSDELVVDTLSAVEGAVYAAETWAFSEIKKGWFAFSFTPEYYGYVGDTTREGRLISYVNGDTYIHDSQTRNNFYGAQFASVVTAILADKIMKTFRGMHYEANKKWVASDIEILPNESYPTGMRSRLKAGNIELKEGDYWADFLRDMNDPNPNLPLPVDKLLNGRLLKGKDIAIRLECDDPNEVYLRLLEVFPTISELTTN